MKKWITLASLLGLLTAAQAQKENLSIQLQAELAAPTNPFYNVGAAGYIKGLYTITHNAQLTFMTGLAKFSSHNYYADRNNRTRIIPFLAGYKRNISDFYVEPQLGFGELGGRYDIGGDYARYSQGAFMFAIGAGYSKKKWDIGLRHQWTETVRYNDNLGFLGLHVGYALK